VITIVSTSSYNLIYSFHKLDGIDRQEQRCLFHVCRAHSFRNGSGSPKPGLFQVVVVGGGGGGDPIPGLSVRHCRRSDSALALPPLKMPGCLVVLVEQATLVRAA
jgi:hypothetical protein